MRAMPEGVELAHGHDGAGALRGDQTQKGGPDQGLIGGQELTQGGVGVAGQGPGDTAQGAIAGVGQQRPLAIPLVPQRACRELQ